MKLKAVISLTTAPLSPAAASLALLWRCHYLIHEMQLPHNGLHLGTCQLPALRFSVQLPLLLFSPCGNALSLLSFWLWWRIEGSQSLPIALGGVLQNSLILRSDAQLQEKYQASDILALSPSQCWPPHGCGFGEKLSRCYEELCLVPSHYLNANRKEVCKGRFLAAAFRRNFMVAIGPKKDLGYAPFWNEAILRKECNK